MKQLYLMFLTLFVVVTVCGSLYLVMNRPIPSVVPAQPSEPALATPTPRPEVEALLRGGSSLSDPEGLYSILYPNTYVVDTSDPLHPRIFKHGATQRGQTEMYDGVIMVFESIDLVDVTLEEWVDRRIREASGDGVSTLIKEKTPITLNTYPGFTYQMRGLGEFTSIVVQKNLQSTQALLITYMVADPENVGFQRDVDATLATLQLLQ